MEKYYLIKNLCKNKKAQAWCLDLVIASVIFLIGIIILYVYAINYSSQTKKNQLGLKYDFYFVMDDLEANGNPVGYMGKSNTSEIENLIQVTRLTIYKNKPVKF